MPIPLPSYVKIKDKLCIAYFGNSNEYLIQLKLLRPYIERTFYGLHIYIACDDSVFNLLENEKNVVKRSEFKESNYGHTKHINCNMQDHPIEVLFSESDIEIPIITLENNQKSKKCLIYPHGNYPTKSLTEEQIKKLTKIYKNQGFQVEIDGKLDFNSMIIGVENEQLFLAASNNAKTILINTGIGSNLFKKMFPKNEILNHI
jgi:hypothetical protein